MSLSKKILKNSLKGCTVTVLVGTCTLLCTQALMAHQLSTSTLMSTSYTASKVSATLNRKVPEGYVKTAYKVEDDTIYQEIGFNVSPATDSELSREEAAEIVTQEIFRLSKTNLTDKTIKMTHLLPSNSTCEVWHATVDINDNLSFNVFLNAHTGELLTIEKHINSKNTITSEQADVICEKIYKTLEENRVDYTTKAQDLITKSGLIPEAIKSCNYIGFGITGAGEPKYFFEVTTASGQEYQFGAFNNFTEVIELHTPAYFASLIRTRHTK